MIDTKLFKDKAQIKYDPAKNKFVELNSDDSDYSLVSEDNDQHDQ